MTTVSVPFSVVDDAIVWAKENCTGRFFTRDSTDLFDQTKYNTTNFHFWNKDDAVLFSLRWT